MIGWYPEEQSLWQPPPIQLVSEWMEDNVVLVPPSEIQGPFRFNMTPYLKPMIDCLLDPEVEEVVICKSAQIGLTQGMIGAIGYYACNDPCAIMFILADQDTAEYMSTDRIQPMFRGSSKLHHLVNESGFTQGENKLRNGSVIYLAWASSVAKLASRPVKFTVCDEVDKPGYNVNTREANPLSLIRERSETFFNRKDVKLSTPTDENGNIWRALNSCDVIFDFHVPCPHCGMYQPLRWSMEHCIDFPDSKYRDEDGQMRQLGQVVWDGRLDATQEQIANAGYQCGSCGRRWTTVQKNEAVRNYQVVPRQPFERRKKVGFHINRIYSLLGKSGDIPKLVSAFIEAKTSNDPTKMQGFINSTLAEPWRQQIVATTENEILRARCELPPQTAPKEAVALTVGVDVQKYGFWFTVWAWARDYTSWLIHYGHVPTWDDIEHVLFSTMYPVEGVPERGLKPWRAAVDTGGGEDDEGGLSMTEETYWWVRKNARGRGCRVWGTKGASQPLAGKVHVGKALDKTPSGKTIPGGLQIIQVDTGKCKDMFFYRLDRALKAEGLGAYLHSGTGEDFAKQITAEEKRKDRRGKEEWVKIRRDNHLLDCSVLAHACADPEWPGGGVHLLRAGETIETQHEPQREEQNRNQRKENWLGRKDNWLRR